MKKTDRIYTEIIEPFLSENIKNNSYLLELESKLEATENNYDYIYNQNFVRQNGKEALKKFHIALIKDCINLYARKKYQQNNDLNYLTNSLRVFEQMDHASFEIFEKESMQSAIDCIYDNMNLIGEQLKKVTSKVKSKKVYNETLDVLLVNDFKNEKIK